MMSRTLTTVEKHNQIIKHRTCGTIAKIVGTCDGQYGYGFSVEVEGNRMYLPFKNITQWETVD